MEKGNARKILLDSIVKKSGVDAPEVQKVLDALGFERLVGKLEALHTMLEPASGLGKLNAPAKKFAAAIDPGTLDAGNLRLEYQLHGAFDGFASSVNA